MLMIKLKLKQHFLLILLSLITINNLFAECESIEDTSLANLCKAFQLNFIDLNNINCDKEFDSVKDPSGQQNLYCKALNIAKNPNATCEDSSINLIQFKSLCSDVKNYLLDRPCFYSEHNKFCKIANQLNKNKNCDNLPIGSSGIKGESPFFKENKFFIKNEKTVCNALKESNSLELINKYKEQFKIEYKIDFLKKLQEKKIETMYTFNRQTPENIKSTIAIDYRDCKINVSQIIEDTTPEIDQIQGWRFKHQDYLLLDLKREKLEFISDLESGWGRLHFYFNNREFHSDSSDIISLLFNLSEECYSSEDDFKHYISIACNREPSHEIFEQLSSQMKKVIRSHQGDIVLSTSKTDSSIIRGSLYNWGSMAPSVSILDQEQLKSIFDYFINKSNVPFNYAYDQCFSRSLIFGKLAADKGIEVGQVFIFAPYRKYLKVVNPLSQDPIYFYYHVAPFVLWPNPNKEEKLEMMIFDPSLCNLAPLTLNEWTKIMTSHGPSLKKKDLKIEIRNRFAYGTAGASLIPASSYNDYDLKDATLALEKTKEYLEKK